MSNNAERGDLSPALNFTASKQLSALAQTWWAREDLNFRPHAYQARALTNSATSPLEPDTPHHLESGGADRDRTDDLKLAKLALSQLSYGPDRN